MNLEKIKNLNLYERFKTLNQSKIYDAFIEACSKGDVESLDYLLYSKELKYNSKGFNKFSAVLEAVENRHINVVKYLITSTEIKKNHLPFVQNNFVLDAIRRNEDMPMIKYLIFEVNIEKTEFMQSFLKTSTLDYYKQVAELYNVRDLKNSLIEKLNEKDKIKKNKIKI